MKPPRLLIDKARWSSALGDAVPLIMTEMHYLRTVLRLQEGATVVVFDGQGREAETYLVAQTLVVVGPVRAQPALLRMTLWQGLLKHDKFEWVVQKATELGVSQIVPVHCKHSVVRLEESRAHQRVARWQQIAQQAAQQCGRSDVPQVGPVTEWEAAWASPAPGRHLLFHERATQVLSGAHLSADPLHIWVGPEGGFSPTEVTQAEGQGAQILSLGPRVLRAETAALAALAVVGHLSPLSIC